MKKERFLVVFFYLILILSFTSCSKKEVLNKEEELKKLKKESIVLNKKIEKLEKELYSNVKDVKKVLVRRKKLEIIDFNHFIETQGTVESDNNILVPARAGGVVSKIFVKEGEKIRKGKVLAELDASIIKGNIDELKVKLDLQKAVYERRERLWKQKIGSEIEYLTAKSKKESLEKSLEVLKEKYKETKIIAPISGRIDNIFLKEGEFVRKNSGALRLTSFGKLKIKASISENYIKNIKKGDKVGVKFPVLGLDFQSKIISVSNVVDMRNRTFDLIVDIPKKEKNIKPNMLALLKINDYTSKSLVLPLNVLHKSLKGDFVFLIQEKDGNYIAKRTNVKAGRSYGHQIEVLQGVKEGDYIAVEGFQDLTDNRVVKLEE